MLLVFILSKTNIFIQHPISPSFHNGSGLWKAICISQTNQLTPTSNQ